MKKVAYIFEDIGGWFVNDAEDVLENRILDTRGKPYRNKTCAIRAASSNEYTHYQQDKKVTKIPAKLHETNWATG